MNTGYAEFHNSSFYRIHFDEALDKYKVSLVVK